MFFDFLRVESLIKIHGKSATIKSETKFFCRNNQVICYDLVAGLSALVLNVSSSRNN